MATARAVRFAYPQKVRTPYPAKIAGRADNVTNTAKAGNAVRTSNAESVRKPFFEKIFASRFCIPTH